MYVLPDIVFILFIAYRLPETLGKETHQIVQQLLKHKKRNKADDKEFLNNGESTQSTQKATDPARN